MSARFNRIWERVRISVVVIRKIMSQASGTFNSKILVAMIFAVAFTIAPISAHAARHDWVLARRSRGFEIWKTQLSTSTIAPAGATANFERVYCAVTIKEGPIRYLNESSERIIDDSKRLDQDQNRILALFSIKNRRVTDWKIVGDPKLSGRELWAKGTYVDGANDKVNFFEVHRNRSGHGEYVLCSSIAQLEADVYNEFLGAREREGRAR